MTSYFFDHMKDFRCKIREEVTQSNRFKPFYDLTIRDNTRRGVFCVIIALRTCPEKKSTVVSRQNHFYRQPTRSGIFT